jgi:kynurenine formamidase
MTRTTHRVAITCLTALFVGSTELAAQVTDIRTQADLDRQVAALSNWGRWGDADERGTLNLLTPQKRLEAVALVKTGESVSLSRIMRSAETPRESDSFTHSMVSIGKGTTGPWSMDRYSVAYHGGTYTHMDSLCHLFYRGKMFNGFSRDEVDERGAGKLSIMIAQHGIVTRGVLIDVPRLRGVRFLEPGTIIDQSDFEEWERQTGLTIRPGDVVFIRTGKWLAAAEGSAKGLAGIHARSVPWLKQRDIAMLGSDGAGDVLPSRVDGVEFPVHVLLLHAMGTPMFDNCDLDPLAEKAAALGRWEFMLTASPLVVYRGTGSPLNPIATF